MKNSGSGLSSSTWRLVLVVGCSEKSSAVTMMPATPVHVSSRASKALYTFFCLSSAAATASDTNNNMVAHWRGVSGNGLFASGSTVSTATRVSFTSGRRPSVVAMVALSKSRIRYSGRNCCCRLSACVSALAPRHRSLPNVAQRWLPAMACIICL